MSSLVFASSSPINPYYRFPAWNLVSGTLVTPTAAGVVALFLGTTIRNLMLSLTTSRYVLQLIRHCSTLLTTMYLYELAFNIFGLFYRSSATPSIIPLLDPEPHLLPSPLPQLTILEAIRLIISVKSFLTALLSATMLPLVLTKVASTNHGSSTVVFL